MAKRHSTKKALLLSALSLLLCCSMLVGTTFAWFTDSVTSSGNIIQSGKLDVEMYWADGTRPVPSADSTEWIDASTGAIFNYDKWEPGFVQVRHIKIANAGNLALKYKVIIKANGEVSDLSDVIDVYYADQAIQIADREYLQKANKLCTLTEALANLDNSGNGTLEAGQSDTITIALKMQESAGNEYQGKSLGTDFSVQLLATQLMHEDDSFGKEYDKESTYPSTSTNTIGGTESITTDNVTVTLPTGAEKDVYTLNVDNKEVNTNEKHETVVSLNIDLLKNGVKVDAAENAKYTIDIEIGKSLVITGLTHKGEPITDYTYNALTGFITFTTDSFSPFAITYSENVIKVATAEDLISALNEIKTEAKKQIPGETGNKAYRENAIFVLENDIVIDSADDFMYTDSNGAALHFYGVRGLLDLNGHNITVTDKALMSGKAHANAVLLVQYSNIDIIGEGSIIAQNKSIPVYGWANSTINIYGGNYVTNAPERNESAVYVNNPTVMIHVYGGTYTDSAYAFNVHNNCGSTTTIVLHKGITYADFFKDTVDLVASDIANGRIAIAEGCELVEYEENGIAMNKVK